MRKESSYAELLFLEQVSDCIGSRVANPQPYDFGRVTSDEAELTEIVVLRYHAEIVTSCMLPQFDIRPAFEACEPHVFTPGEGDLEPLDEPGAEVFVER